MSDNTTTDDQNAEDDWAAALAEQEASFQPGGDQGDAAKSEMVLDAETASDNGNHAEDSEGDVFLGAQNAQATVFQELSNSNAVNKMANDIDLILDIPVQLTVELGRTKIAIKNLLQLAQGSVVELDGLAGEPMNVLVNGCLIAQGEVVVVNDKFGIRLTDVITPSERIRKLNR